MGHEKLMEEEQIHRLIKERRKIGNKTDGRKRETETLSVVIQNTNGRQKEKSGNYITYALKVEQNIR